MAKNADKRVTDYQAQNGSRRLTSRQISRVAKVEKQALGKTYPETKKSK